MTDDEWDSISPKRQEAHVEKMLDAQCKKNEAIKKAVTAINAFVRVNPAAVVSVKGAVDSTPGVLKRYTLSIVVDGERYAEFIKARAAK